MLYSGFPSRFLNRQTSLKNPLSTCVLAIVLPLVALAVTLLLWRTIYPAVFLLFFGAVSIVALQSGFWPGLLATVESAILADYVMFPDYGWARDAHTLLRISIFVLCGVLISWLGERQLRGFRIARQN